MRRGLRRQLYTSRVPGKSNFVMATGIKKPFAEIWNPPGQLDR